MPRKKMPAPFRGRTLRTPERSMRESSSHLGRSRSKNSLLGEYQYAIELLREKRKADAVEHNHSSQSHKIIKQGNNTRQEEISDYKNRTSVRIKFITILSKILKKQCKKFKYSISINEENIILRRAKKLLDTRLDGLNIVTKTPMREIIYKYRLHYPEKEDKKTVNELLKELLEGFETVDSESEEIHDDCENTAVIDSNNTDLKLVCYKESTPDAVKEKTPDIVHDTDNNVWEVVEEVLQDFEFDLMDEIEDFEVSSEAENTDNSEDQLINININFISKN